MENGNFHWYPQQGGYRLLWKGLFSTLIFLIVSEVEVSVTAKSSDTVILTHPKNPISFNPKKNQGSWSNNLNVQLEMVATL